MNKHKIRAWEIRTPLTLTEAKAGIALARKMLECFDETEHADDKRIAAEAARRSWEQKLCELEYAQQRLIAGEPVETADDRIRDLMRDLSDCKKEKEELFDRLTRVTRQRDALKAQVNTRTPLRSSHVHTVRQSRHRMPRPRHRGHRAGDP